MDGSEGPGQSEGADGVEKKEKREESATGASSLLQLCQGKEQRETQQRSYSETGSVLRDNSLAVRPNQEHLHSGGKVLSDLFGRAARE